jgi:hypothetical protein
VTLGGLRCLTLILALFAGVLALLRAVCLFIIGASMMSALPAGTYHVGRQCDWRPRERQQLCLLLADGPVYVLCLPLLFNNNPKACACLETQPQPLMLTD